jgi:hypothetical protein
MIDEQETSLTIGSRVRVLDCLHTDAGHRGRGRAGTVVATDWPAMSLPDLTDTHVYLVRFDEPAGRLESWSYADDELGPLDE